MSNTESNILKAIEITPSSYIHVPTEYCTKAVMYAAYCHMPALLSGFPKQYQNEELVLHGVRNGVSLNQVPHPYHGAVYQDWKAEPKQFNLKGIESFPDSPAKALRDLRIPKSGKREKSQPNDGLLICYLREQPLQLVWDAARHSGEQEFLYTVFGSKLLEVANAPDSFKRKWLEQDLGL